MPGWRRRGCSSGRRSAASRRWCCSGCAFASSSRGFEAMARKRNQLLDFLAFLPQGAFLALVRALPWKARLATGSFVLRAAVALVPDFRRRIDGNLRMIFPEMPEAERKRV